MATTDTRQQQVLEALFGKPLPPVFDEPDITEAQLALIETFTDEQRAAIAQVVRVARISARLEVYRAVRYVLDRIQDSPNVRYYCGYGTQIFYELIQAEALCTGMPLDTIEAKRRIDTEPEYRKTLPRVIQLEEKLSDARRDCTCGGVQ